MKRETRFRSSQFLCFAIAAAVSWGCAGTKAVERKEGPDYEPETQSWLAALHRQAGSGMWIVSRGYHPGDDLVAIATNSPLSHVSIVDMKTFEVIEAIGKGVVVTPLPAFMRETQRFLLIRPSGWTKEKGLEAVARARSKIGSGYDYLGAVGIPNENRFYCSELAAWSMGIEVDQPGPEHVLLPRHMDRYGQVLFDTGDRDGKPDSFPSHVSAR